MIVVRKCTKCGYEGEDEEGFYYLGDGIYQCAICFSKYTHIKEIIDSE